jgi:hypothetical protein
MKICPLQVIKITICPLSGKRVSASGQQGGIVRKQAGGLIYQEGCVIECFFYTVCLIDFFPVAEQLLAGFADIHDPDHDGLEVLRGHKHVFVRHMGPCVHNGFHGVINEYSCFIQEFAIDG